MASFVPILFAVLALFSEANAHNVVTTTCDKTLYKDLCKSTFASIPGTKNLDGLAKIALTLATKQAGEIQAHIKVLSKKTSDKSSQQCLSDCSENYGSAIGKLQDSLKALQRKSYFNINTWVTAAMSDAESCEDGFKGVAKGSSPLTPLKKKFNGLCSIILTISNLLDAKNVILH